MNEHNHSHHSDDHDHDHDHGFGHHHHDTTDLSDARLLGTFLLNLLLTLVEAGIGLFSGSVALVADAVHNFGDAISLLIAYIARQIAKRDADVMFSFGYHRAETVGAVINLTTLIVMAFFLVAESVERFVDPQPVLAKWVIVAASVALFIDLVTVGLLWAMSKGNLNLRAAFIHNLSDAFASVAVIIGAVIIEIWGFLWVDALFALLIAGYILLTSFHMLKRAVPLLMNSAPPNFDIQVVHAIAANIDGIDELHHIHVWEIDETRRAIIASVRVPEETSLEAVQTLRESLRQQLHDECAIEHATLEFEISKRC